VDCSVCGLPIIGRRIHGGNKPTKYCSKACGIKASMATRAARRPPRETLICPTCYSMFTPRQKRQQFCCRWCANRGASKPSNRKAQSAEPPTPELILLRAAAIRARRGTEFAILTTDERMNWREVEPCLQHK
jgi:hypothetical protein